jgi:hypothetical protein
MGRPCPSGPDAEARPHEGEAAPRAPVRGHYLFASVDEGPFGEVEYDRWFIESTTEIPA